MKKNVIKNVYVLISTEIYKTLSLTIPPDRNNQKNSF